MEASFPEEEEFVFRSISSARSFLLMFVELVHNEMIIRMEHPKINIFRKEKYFPDRKAFIIKNVGSRGNQHIRSDSTEIINQRYRISQLEYESRNL